MTLSELNEKRNALLASGEEIVALVEKEVRKMNEDETSKFDQIKAELDEINEEIRKAEADKARAELESRKIDNKNIPSMHKMENQKSLLRSVQDAIREKRNVTLPMFEKRDLNASDENGGGKAVETDIYEIVSALRSDGALAQAGATFLTGLKANESIVLYGGTTAYWVNEGEDITDGAGTLTKTVLSPKIISARIVISNQMILQDVAGLQDMLKNDIVSAVNEAFENAVLGDSNDSKQPQGLLYGADSVDCSWANVLDMEQTLLTNKVQGEKTIICAPSSRTKLLTNTVSGTKSDLRLIMQDDAVDGVKVITSPNVAQNGYIIGDFKDLVIGIFDSANILINPYSLASKNQTEIIVTMFCNCVQRRAASFVAKKFN